jgi:hypothetical protein
MGILVPGVRGLDVIGLGVFAGSWAAEERQGAGGARPSRPVGADGEGLARPRRTRACCPSGPAATPSRGTNLSLSSSPPSVPHQTPYNPTGESPNNRQMATSWTSGWSSDGQRPRPHCPGMRSPPTLQAHKLNNGGSDRQTALVRPIGITVRRPTVRPHPSMGCALRPSEPTRNGRTLSVCAGHRLGWSPPPESNRRPHPYHGTTRNRCANRRFPRSRPTVGAEVIGSPSAKLCALFKPCADRRSSKPSSRSEVANSVSMAMKGPRWSGTGPRWWPGSSPHPSLGRVDWGVSP